MLQCGGVDIIGGIMVILLAGLVWAIVHARTGQEIDSLNLQMSESNKALVLSNSNCNNELSDAQLSGLPDVTSPTKLACICLPANNDMDIATKRRSNCRTLQRTDGC